MPAASNGWKRRGPRCPRFVNKDQKLQFSYNYLGLDEYKAISSEKVPAGKVRLRWEFTRTGAPDFKAGKGAPGSGKLFINGKEVGTGKIPVTVPLAYGLSGDGLSCGRDTGTAVSADYFAKEYPFTAIIRRVTVHVGTDQHPRLPCSSATIEPVACVTVFT